MWMEIFNGIERRRRWPDDEKMRIIEETFAPGAKVSEIAHRHGVGRSVLFAWRRQARSGEFGGSAAPRLVPVKVDVSRSTVGMQSPPASAPRPARSAEKRSGLIEIDLGSGKCVRVDANVDADALGRVLDVLSCR
jgi:transposase